MVLKIETISRRKLLNLHFKNLSAKAFALWLQMWFLYEKCVKLIQQLFKLRHSDIFNGIIIQFYNSYFWLKIHSYCFFGPHLEGNVLCSWQGLCRNGLIAISFDRICVALFSHTLWHLRSNVLLQMLHRPCRTDKHDGGPLGWLSL